jgi:predicted transcriptional regulator of viral defense system
MTTAPLAFERMVELAAQQNGFLRTADAKDIGVDTAYLRKLATTGRLQHRGWGLYRVRAIPPTPRDEYQEAILWAGDDAAIGAEAALALWELADVNPRTIDVVLPPGGRVRKHGGGKVRLIHDRLAPAELDWVDNIRVVTPAKAIAQTIARGLDGTLIEQAINNGRARQLFTPLTEARLRVRLADREQGTYA